MIGVLNVLFENPEHDLRQFYHELKRHFAEAGIEHRVFVLDNSMRAHGDIVPGEAAFAHCPENVGYTRACNRLMADAFAAGCEAVIAMNVDGFPLPGCVGAMLTTLEQYGGDALVEARQFPSEHPRTYDARTGITDWVSGCCLLIGRRTYERLGPLDDGMFLYCEDVDYSFRARLAGVPCVVSTAALFYHRVSALPIDPARRKNMLVSARYLASKWRNPTARELFEDSLVAERFFGSAAEMPPVPAEIDSDVETIRWDPAFRMTFAPARWRA